MENLNDNDRFGESELPEQQTGSAMDAVEKIEMRSAEEAKLFFRTVKQRLLNVNAWAEITGIPMSAFCLTDRTGQPVHRNATIGDYLRIDIPGPGTKTGDGFDWVVIEEIKESHVEEGEILTMQVRPAPNPQTPDDHTAHFLKDTATSTFQVKRIGNRVYAEEHARNEVPNTDTGHTLDNVRNMMVGWAAKIGFAYPQWKSLVKGLISTENKYKS